MAFRQRVRCFTCDSQGNSQNMPRIGDDENKQQLARARRAEFDLPEQDIVNETRVCFNCNNALLREVAGLGEDYLRLNVIIQRRGRTCFICNAINGVTRVSHECRVFTFVHYDLFIPFNVRVFPIHLDANGQIIHALINGIRYVLRGQQLQLFLTGLQQTAREKNRLEKADDFDDSEFECLFPITKAQFEELFNQYCVPVPEGNINRYVKRKDLMVFLCKLRQGLSDEFLKVLFNYNSRQAVSTAISIVRRSLLAAFVPENIGLQ